MEQKILALDLGSNSIGGTIRDLTDRKNQFKKTTVITFETGVGKDDYGRFTLSHAAERTSKRSLRRLYQSRKYKLWETLEVLRKENYCPINEKSLERWKQYDKSEAIKGNGGRAYPIDDVKFNNWIKLDFNNDGIPDYSSPYELREELATAKLDFTNEENRYKLGRALYHIAQHRGFKSSKKLQNADDEKDENNGEVYDKLKGAEGKKTKKLWEAIAKLSIGINETITIGQAFSQIEKSNKENGANIRIRKELHQFVTRKMLMHEVDTIFKFQEISFGSIFKNKKGEEIKISQSPMFWQRPLRSQKGTIGKCTLETNKYRCPVSHPAFEEFRAWSFLNNIQFKIRDEKESEWQQIPFDYRKEIYEQKFFRRKTKEFNYSEKDFYFIEIADWIKKKNQHDNWQLNYNFKTNVAACPVSAKLKDIFGDDWKNYSLETEKIKQVRKKDGSVKEHKTTYDIDAIWHILFDSDDEDMVEEFATEVLKLDDKKTNRFMGLYKSMPVAYSMLSLKAINNILPFLRDGLIYTEATLLAKVPKILGDEIWASQKENIFKNLTKEVIDKNREEKRILNIVNNLIAQYKALPVNEQFAKNNFTYVLGEKDNLLDNKSKYTDANQILAAIIDSYGEQTWKEKDAIEQKHLLQSVGDEYQQFFFDKDRKFKKLPHLQKSMKQFLATKFDFLKCPNTFKELKDGEQKCECNACKKLNSLYHPSQIDIYPAAKEEHYKYGEIDKQMVMLGSPKTGAFKNPMALRALHELRKYINYLIATEQIDEQTRIVVEIPRESNLDDSNRRWAWDEFQKRRRGENKEFRDAIYELIKDPQASGSIVNPDSDSDIDKFRIWYEMIQGNDTIEGCEEKKIFAPLEKTSSTKKNKKGEEEIIEEFNEDNYLKINKSLFFKLQKAKENVEEKYRLWKEQEYQCLYTGNIIRITDLFQENRIDFEHTIPRSRSLDNSLANLTVCDANFNRNIKKNKMPRELDNYADIKTRLEKWEQKVKDLQLHVNFWKAESKRASTKDRKDQCIRQRHLWQFELDYWKDKVERFTMTEVKSGFRKSQLVDTQIISKYAFHFLKTYFNTVEVQKGSITAEFRKIFGIQEIGTDKDRNKHTHHAKDAVVLSLIPIPTIREKMLATWYEIQETKDLLLSDTEYDKQAIQDHIIYLEEQLRLLKCQCNVPNVNAIIDKIDEQTLINNIAKDNSLVEANRRIRSRGKIVPLKDKNGNKIYKTDENGKPIQRRYKDGKLIWKIDEQGNLKLDKDGNKIPVYEVKEKWAKGDAIRGQLHEDSFLGAIKLVKKDNKGKWIKKENGEYEFEDIKYVIRKGLVYKKNPQSPGFKDLEDLKNQIVDKALFAIIENQVKAVGDFKEALANGIWMINKQGENVHKIRRIRIEVSATNPIAIKKQTYKNSTPSTILPDRKHKEQYWAVNGKNIILALYQNTVAGKQKTERELEIVTLRDAAALLSLKQLNKKREVELYQKGKKGNTILNENGKPIKPFALLKPGMKVIFYDESINELKQKEKEEKLDYKKRISYRMYNVVKFSGGRITFQHHLEARGDKKLKIAYPKDKIYMTDKENKEIKYGVSGTSGFSRPVSDALKYNGYNNYEPFPKLLYSKDSLNMAIEGKHFEIMPDGEIILYNL
ncbi:MAG: hypothetical protein JST94_08040 [Bacteroidetes bacterium]|nr:hypothetical protein [Bacteroidota bacterium]MBS1671388.1 hypothetical protein [Bacteroidota bacterium]